MNIQYNLDKICRICMCEANNMKKIFSPAENISKILMSCSSVIVSENDELPKQICLQCVKHANSANNFKQLCEQSDNVLRNYIKLKNTLIDNIKQEKFTTVYEVTELFESDEDNSMSNKSRLFDETNAEKKIDNCDKTKFNCDLCCENFQHLLHLTKHKELHCDNGVYSCNICSCFFVNQKYLLSHNNTHHQNTLDGNSLNEGLDDCNPIIKIIKEEPNTSDNCYTTQNQNSDANGLNCGENGKRKRGRPKQSQKLEQKELFRCSFCNECFQRKLHLKRHTESEHGDKLLPIESHQCSQCEKSFPKIDMLRKHMKQHSVQNYMCNECPKKFNKLEQLTEHRKRHTGERSYLCSKCGKGYFKQPHLDKHMLTHLKDHLEKPVYQCTFCGKKLNHSNHLQVHMRTHRDRYGQPLIPQTPNPNKKVILCSVCGKSCSSRSNLAVHMRRHTGQMTNFCKICGKGYPRTTDLTLHMRKHTGEKPFVCTVCNRGFARSDKLAIHMRTHTGEKPYACTICGRAFAQSNDLASHKRRNMCGQNNVINISQSHNTQNTSITPIGGTQLNSAKASDVVISDVMQRLERVPDSAVHRTIELPQANLHNRMEYSEYTTATLLQNLSNGHFMR